MNSHKAITVISPIHNFEDGVEELYRGLVNVLEASRLPFELIFVDDGSTDGTFPRLSKLASGDSRVKLIKMRSSFGEASAFDAGLRYSTGDTVIYMTARVRVNPQGIRNLLKKLEEGYDLVIAWRNPRRDSKLNQIISKGFNWIVRKISRVNLHDVNSGVIATRRDVIRNIPLYGDLNNFIPILACRQGYRVTEAQVEQLPGAFRQSRYVKEYIQRLLDIITVIFLTNYSKKPIHFLGFVGAIFTLVGAAISFYLFVYRILAFGPIAGRPLLLLGVLLLVIGIQMISIGLIGEMIIFTHAGEIKEYNVERIIEHEGE